MWKFSRKTIKSKLHKQRTNKRETRGKGVNVGGNRLIEREIQKLNKEEKAKEREGGEGKRER